MADMAAESLERNSVKDPLLTAIIANRFDGIIREMTNTLLRTARSAVISGARDLSCSITTADSQLLASAEGLPTHIFGSHIQNRSMCALHPDLAEGDAFLDNDPYLGNTHPADHTILVPVFVEDEHLFTVVAKAHQADIGNSVPTTYFAAAKDVYEEGALVFPCVRVQRDYKAVEDVIRMCRKRIRVPDQWHGDFLAALGAARIGERGIKELCAKYGKATIKSFVSEWFAYSERCMIQAIRRLPKARLVNEGVHDPFATFLPDGLPIKVVVDVDPVEAMIEIDLRDNVDCIGCGLNVSEACAVANALAGVCNCVEAEVPANSGSFRRIEVRLREGSVLGAPTFPHSCSMSTTNLVARELNAIQSAFAQLGDGFGLAEGGIGMGAGLAVISGRDFRRNGEPYINQLFASYNGGPASPVADGWLCFCTPQVCGLMYRDSVEVDEFKHPIEIKSVRALVGTGGAGRFRGAVSSEIIFGPKRDPVTVTIPCDGQINPPKGVRGGHDGIVAETYKIDCNGGRTKLPNLVQIDLGPGELICGIENSGGGYGNSHERDPQRVLHDVLEEWETVERAYDIYGVVLSGNIDDETLGIDYKATKRRRIEMAERAMKVDQADSER